MASDRHAGNGNGRPDRDARAWLRDATVRFGRGDQALVALDGVTLSVGPDETVALLGRSGSGKTTLLHAMSGLIEIDAGEAYPGRSRFDRDAPADAKRVGLVTQGSSLLPTLTAYENVAFAHRAAQAFGGDVQLPDPRHLLHLVGLGDRGDALPAELSGGESQRVAVARALATSPRLLLCDEPTGQLDHATAERVLDLVFAACERFGASLVVATHAPDVAQRCKRVVELDDGRVVSDTRNEALRRDSARREPAAPAAHAAAGDGTTGTESS